MVLFSRKNVLFTTLGLLFGPALFAQTLDQGFANPPVDARPKAFWDWVNGNFNYAQLRYELREAKEKGMGGFDIWDVGTRLDQRNFIPAGPPFLGDESVAAIKVAVDEATRQGLEIGLVTSSSWNAGGTWVKPEDGILGVFDTAFVVRGPRVFDELLPKPRVGEGKVDLSSVPLALHTPKFYQPLAVVAVKKEAGKTPEVLNLTARTDAEGRLRWEVPAGEWTLHRLMAVNTGQPLHVPSPASLGLMIDHFSAAAQRRNLGYVLDRLRPALGDFRKTTLKYLYIDSYEVRGIPWSKEFPAEFRRRRGYDPTAYLVLLRDSTAYPKAVAERFYFDYERTLSDMIVENHYIQGREICAREGLGYYGEASGPGKPVHNVPFESLRSAGSLSVPRGEFWLGMDDRRDAEGNSHLDMVKGVASASHLYDRRYVEAESFTQVPMYREDFSTLKRYADRAFCEGLNRIVLHTFHHNPPEAGKPGYNYPFGTVFGTFQPWWQVSRGFFDYLSRASYLLQQGRFVADVLYYYGDQAPNFVKEATIRKLVGAGYDFDAVNSEKLLQLEFKNGFFTLPHGQRYRLLVLPDQPTMQPELLAKIEKLVAAGATVLGRKPERSQGLHEFERRDEAVRTLAAKLWGMSTENRYGKGRVVSGKSVTQVLQSLGVGPDFRVVGASDSAAVRFIHRLGDGGEDVYFVSNQNPRWERLDASFRVAGRLPERFDLQTGEITPLKVFSQTSTHTTLPLLLPPGGSVAVVFRKPLSGVNFIQEVRKNGSPVFPLAPKTSPQADTTGSLTNALFAGPGAYELRQSDGKVFNQNVTAPTVQTLSGPWDVRFPFGHGAPTHNTFAALTSWTASAEPGIRYFSGVATYRKTFTLPELPPSGQTVTLDLGDVKDMAEVWVNGHPAGYAWAYPYRLDVTKFLKAGENVLVIDVANGLNNRQVGDAVEKNPRLYTQSNIDRGGTSAWSSPWEKVPLLKAGLLGPVRLVTGAAGF